MSYDQALNANITMLGYLRTTRPDGNLGMGFGSTGATGYTGYTGVTGATGYTG